MEPSKTTPPQEGPLARPSGCDGSIGSGSAVRAFTFMRLDLIRDTQSQMSGHSSHRKDPLRGCVSAFLDRCFRSQGLCGSLCVASRVGVA